MRGIQSTQSASSKRRKLASIPKGDKPILREKQKWVSKDGQKEIEIIGAAPGWGHIGIAVRDNVGAKMVSTAVLYTNYQLKEDSDSNQISVEKSTEKPTEDPYLKEALAKQSQNDKEPDYRSKRKEPMTKKQEGFLKSLCKKTGEDFNPELTKIEATKEIDRLKKLSSN
jgi:hypothetical protein